MQGDANNKYGFKANLETDTLKNNYFRQVLYTAPHSQLVLMSLKPMEEIGMEVHPENDQFLRFEAGEGKAIINGVEYLFATGDCVIVPANSQHNIINTSETQDLKLYTVYSPAHHPDGTIHKTKEEALASEK